MKKIMLLLCVMFVLLSLGPCSAADNFSSRPEVFLPESVFEFQPVVEGIRVVHTFILHNRGEKALEMIDIKSDLG